MKKKSPSQSAFFNPRALIGLFFCFAGVLIAFFAFGAQETAPQAKPKSNALENTMTRQDLAGMYEAMAPAGFVPPACVAGSEMFDDVLADNPFCPWVEELARQGITTGCAPNLFCPGDPVTRQQMAVFIVRALDAAKPDQTILFNVQAVAANASFSLFSPICPAGTHAVSGGWRAANFDAPVEMAASRPTANGGFGDISGTNVANQWLVQGVNSATAQNYSVFVVCANTRTP
jgi:hypothetical protein